MYVTTAPLALWLPGLVFAIALPTQAISEIHSTLTKKDQVSVKIGNADWIEWDITDLTDGASTSTVTDTGQEVKLIMIGDEVQVFVDGEQVESPRDHHAQHAREIEIHCDDTGECTKTITGDEFPSQDESSHPLRKITKRVEITCAEQPSCEEAERQAVEISAKPSGTPAADTQSAQKLEIQVIRRIEMHDSAKDSPDEASN